MNEYDPAQYKQEIEDLDVAKQSVYKLYKYVNSLQEMFKNGFEQVELEHVINDLYAESSWFVDVIADAFYKSYIAGE